MNLKIDIEKIKEWITHAPLHFLIPAVVLVLVVLLAGVRIVWFNHRAPVVPVAATKAPPAPAVSVPVAKPVAVPTSTPSAASAPVATSSVATQANALMVEPPKPGVAAPAGLLPMKALYTLESSPSPALNAQPAWSELGHKLLDANAASFQTVNVKSLDGLMPSSGLVRETWSFWTQVRSAGSWVVALKAGGYYQSVVTVQVDGRDVSALAVHPGNDVVNAVATLKLGGGWHQVTIKFTQQIYQNRELLHGTAELFWRGPTDAQPVVIVPSFVDPTKAQPAVPEESADEGRATPASASSTARAASIHPAPASSAAGGAK